MRKIFYSFFSIVLFLGLVYFGTGFYIAHTILRIDHSCGVHEGSLPNTWSTKLDYRDIQFIEYFLSKHKTICKTEQTLIAFKNPKVQIKKQDKNILTFVLPEVFIKYEHMFLTNMITIAFRFDLKKDTIDSIIKEFCISFLIDDKHYETLYNTIGQEMIKIYNNWAIKNLPKNSSDENKKELETIII